jgi:hypothetical protein
VMEAWQQVLGTSVDSPDVSFFDAGGTSLLMLPLHSRLRSMFGRSFPMHDLFRFPTPRGFAAFLDESASAAREEVPAGRSATMAQIAAAAARKRAARNPERKVDA